MSNYLIYPFKTMRITQSYTGTTSHLPHTTGSPKDYPLDEGGKDGGRDGFYCPCDEMKIVRIYGVGNGGTNTMWIESTSKVVFANGASDIATIQITHPTDSDLKRLKVGQKFKRGELICYEGTDGATGNHIHHSVGKGKFTGTGWTKNSKGKYVITTTNGTLKPEAAYAIDTAFTKVVDKKGLGFKTLAEVKKKTETKKETYIVNTDKGVKLNCRKTASTKAAVVATLESGTKLTITETKTADNLKWGKCSKGWVCLKYCKKA